LEARNDAEDKVEKLKPMIGSMSSAKHNDQKERDLPKSDSSIVEESSTSHSLA
jgi:hypothetical protein